MFFAHSENNDQVKHLLRDHLRATGVRMAEMLPAFEAEARIAGYLHDLGKYQEDFQKRLEGSGVRVEHAWMGAALIGKRNSALARVIAAHHAGLGNTVAWQTNGKEWEESEYASELRRCVAAFMKDTGLEEEVNRLMRTIAHERDIATKEAVIRLLLSALADADRLDTEAHFNADKSAAREFPVFDASYILERLSERFRSFTDNTAINALRTRVRCDTDAHACDERGFFSLTLPTGMGKTLTSLYWAARHAEHHGMRRIIIVLPFTSIIDQTAAELKSILGEEYVLEHHASLIPDVAYVKGEDYDPKMLAAENWDAPIIVTTTVQFFETLFAHHPTKCRKLHNVMNAVVIFDEVQSLPMELLAPTLRMLTTIQPLYATSFLFCTATMPAFEKRDTLPDGIARITPLVDDLEEVHAMTRRVRYHFVEALTPIDEGPLADHIAASDTSVLVVRNTKKAALSLYDALPDIWDTRFFLSTALCPHHRKERIRAIKRALAKGRRVLVVSTQLIEAGVDIDFPRLYRELAPLEGVIQSAGRCNRNGTQGEEGEVYLFRVTGATYPPGGYKTRAEYLYGRIIDDKERLHDASFFTEYYANVLALFEDADKQKIRDAQENLDFLDVSQSYRLIKDTTKNVFLMHYNDESRDIYNVLARKSHLTRTDYRRLQPYCVSLFPNDFNCAEKAGMIETLTGKTRYAKEIPMLYVWKGAYDNNEKGIVIPTNNDNDTVF